MLPVVAYYVSQLSMFTISAGSFAARQTCVLRAVTESVHPRDPDAFIGPTNARLACEFWQQLLSEVPFLIKSREGKATSLMGVKSHTKITEITVRGC